MQRLEFANRPISQFPLSLVFLLSFLINAPLLMMKLPLKSYDTNFHIFFAQHYAQHWFDPWNTKWYAGFSQATYPPLPQQWIAILSRFTGLDAAYMIVQFVGILLLSFGVYRFSLLWVDRRAASYAALASVVLTSEAFLVYNAGQLSTTFAAPLYLLALPYIYDWICYKKSLALLKGTALMTAAAAAHHATLIFGSALLAGCVIARAILDVPLNRNSQMAGFLARTVFISALIVVFIGIVLLPFWLALIQYPVTQTPIPHASRANYILSPLWGINYFVVPYGALMFAIPDIIWKGSLVPRLRPLMLAFWVAFLLGLGGTTPVGRWILGRAFEVITLERFTYWATLLALPFVGLLIEELMDRRRWKTIGAIAMLAILSFGFAVAWTANHPADAEYFNVEGVAAWLNRDGHDAYRYITLGFGNKIARLAMLTDAGSLDGEWNSERLLPELTENGGATLTSAKYTGEGGLNALRAILRHADRYGLKWVILKDPFYEPLLVFSGWRRVDELENRTISIWSMEGVPPATPIPSPQQPKPWEGVLWGTLPIGSSIIALLLFLIPDRRDKEEEIPEPVEAVEPPKKEELVFGRMIS